MCAALVVYFVFHQALLFDPSKPFFAQIDRPEEDLLVTCLTAFYKLNFRSTVKEFLLPFLENQGIPSLLSPGLRFCLAAPTVGPAAADAPCAETPTAYQIVAVRCLLSLQTPSRTGWPAHLPPRNCAA
jgi:hypothetical protein